MRPGYVAKKVSLFIPIYQCFAAVFDISMSTSSLSLGLCLLVAQVKYRPDTKMIVAQCETVEEHTGSSLAKMTQQQNTEIQKHCPPPMYFLLTPKEWQTVLH